MFQPRTPSTPLNIKQFNMELKLHPDRQFVSFLIDGLTNGFDTMIPDLVLPNKECKNLLSARQNPDIIDKLLDQECKKRVFVWSF